MYAVLFDIDGTLLQTGGAGHVAFAESFRELFGLDEIPSGIGFAGRSDRAIATEIMRVSGIEASIENWNIFFSDYRQRLERVLQECKGQVLPGVVELLDLLDQEKHTVVGLLTGNTDFGAQAKLSAYGLGGRFAFGGYGDACTNRNDIAAEAKAAAEAFLAHNHPSETLSGTMVLGDTPADVECGRSIGAFVVAVATGGGTYDELAACNPDLLLTNLTDSAAMLSEVAAAKQC